MIKWRSENPGKKAYCLKDTKLNKKQFINGLYLALKMSLFF